VVAKTLLVKSYMAMGLMSITKKGISARAVALIDKFNNR
jgi:hypothetical protein